MSQLKKICKTLDETLMQRLGIPIVTKYRMEGRDVVVTTYSCIGKELKRIDEVSFDSRKKTAAWELTWEIEEIIARYELLYKLMSVGVINDS